MYYLNVYSVCLKFVNLQSETSRNVSMFVTDDSQITFHT
jgi:hypothetical protein